jgi:cysteine desulfurase
VQVLGKVELDLDRAGLDSASVSAHKIHGPKGVGGLALASKARIAPLVTGGGQEGGMRSGTENVPGIVGFAKAAELALSDRVHWTREAARLRDRLEAGCLAAIAGAAVNGHTVHRLPHILSLRVDGVVGEVLLHHLEAEGIFVSTGAACSEGKDADNPVLRALGLSRAEVRSTVRLSVARQTRDEDVDRVLAVLPAIVAKLRRIGA